MKKKTLPRVMFDFTNDVRLPYRKTLNFKFQNINWIPFRDPLFPRFRTQLRYHLGPTNPRTNSVPEETFPTSVYKIHICLFATTTKICIGGDSRRGYPHPSTYTPASLPTFSNKSLMEKQKYR